MRGVFVTLFLLVTGACLCAALQTEPECKALIAKGHRLLAEHKVQAIKAMLADYPADATHDCEAIDQLILLSELHFVVLKHEKGPALSKGVDSLREQMHLHSAKLIAFIAGVQHQAEADFRPEPPSP